MRQPPTTEDFTSPVHHARVVARLGVWLGSAFLLCFLEGAWRLSLTGPQRLPRDHGFPARIIAPNRPGVLQTKWVRALTVSA